jgi:uncharacterized repeat protein (TIGR03803 family)
MGIAANSAQAQTFNVLYSFCSQSNCKDGNTPTAGVIQDAKGNLYGTTSLGGTSNWGTVFDLDSSGTETVLYNFRYINGDGANPFGSLIRDAAGNLYGTAMAPPTMVVPTAKGWCSNWITPGNKRGCTTLLAEPRMGALLMQA